MSSAQGRFLTISYALRTGAISLEVFTFQGLIIIRDRIGDTICGTVGFGNKEALRLLLEVVPFFRASTSSVEGGPK